MAHHQPSQVDKADGPCLPDFFSSLLSLPFASISYEAQRRLSAYAKATRGPASAHVIQCNDDFFDARAFSSAGRCSLSLSPLVFSQVHHTWAPPVLHNDDDDEDYWNDSSVVEPSEKRLRKGNPWEELEEEPCFAWYDIRWDPKGCKSEQALKGLPAPDISTSAHLELVILRIPGQDSCSTKDFTFLVTSSFEVGSRFIVAVQKFVSGLKDRIWVYQNGHWSASTEMFKEVKSVTFDNMVLTSDKGVGIRNDMELFFKSKELYEQYRLPWKRGYLFSGPPGNGKTHLVKALINHVTQVQPSITPLYVKSFKHPYANSDHSCIAAVFRRARMAPCILVLEDLETLVTSANRSFFLNEMDGFYNNSGVVVVATTNYPEKLDPALRDRPSRFDRRFHFALPDAAERRHYFVLWNSSAQGERLQLSSEDAGELAHDSVTGGFSFAYLKELLLSSAMLWLQQQAGFSPIAGPTSAALAPGDVAAALAAPGDAPSAAAGPGADVAMNGQGQQLADGPGPLGVPWVPSAPLAFSATYGELVRRQAEVLRAYIRAEEERVGKEKKKQEDEGGKEGEEEEQGE